MSESFAHLAPEAKTALAQGEEARLDFIKIRHWFDYPRATFISNKLDELVSYPQVGRAPCLLVVGSSNNGKSTIAKMFKDRHRPVVNEETGALKVPVLYIKSLSNPNAEALMVEIIRLLGLPYSSTRDIVKLKGRVYGLLQEFQVRVLVVDELNTIVPLTRMKREAFLAELRSLSVNVGIQVVCFSTKAGATIASYDDAFTSRFPVVDLPVWQCDMTWRMMTASFEAYLPFSEPSRFSSTVFSTRLLLEADHRLGELRDLVETVAAYGIRNKLKCITPDTIEKSGWIKPQDRLTRINNLSA